MTDERYAEAGVAVFGDEPVVAAYLFGSRARGTHHENSDADVAVLLGSQVGPDQYLSLTLRYGRELERLLGLAVDVVILNDAPLRLVGRVLRDRLVIFSGDERARVAFESATMPSAYDFEITASRLDRLLLDAHARGER